MPGASALRELRTLTRALQAGLLALLDAGVARQESAPTKFGMERLVRNREGSCNPVSEGTGLAGDPAPVQTSEDREARVRARGDKGPTGVGDKRRAPEELLDRALVAHDGAIARKQDDAGDRVLALSCGPSSLGNRRVNLQLDSFITMRVRRRGVGAWASWGWASPA